MTENSPKVSNELKRKDRVSGKVMKITLMGALVDIGLSKPAVIPISRLRKGPVHRVEEVLKEGDEVTAWVRHIDAKQDRIELTLIQPLTLEWTDIKRDMVVRGKISKLEKFGAFVEIGAERPGLVHVSEMSHDYVRRPEDAVALGEEVEVKVLDVDKRKKQIKLSIKALAPQPAAEPEKPESEKKEEEPEKPVPTAMEMALRKAMSQEEQSSPIQQEKATKPKKSSQDMEDILARTLENRVKSK